MKLIYCVILSIITFLLLEWQMALPVIVVIPTLSGGARPTGPIELPWIARIMLHPVFCILLVVLAITALGVSIRGAKSERARRGWWILLAVLNVLVLLAACYSAFALPKFMGSFKDMGIK